jgi:heme-degrading monooxygenase HmoA
VDHFKQPTPETQRAAVPEHARSSVLQSDVLPSVQPVAPLFVALSRFTVAQGTTKVKQAFCDRPHLVERASGFVRLDVLSPTELSDEIWLITYWKDETSYRDWHHSHLYHESHQGIPAGLKLVPKSVSIQFFEHIAS